MAVLRTPKHAYLRLLAALLQATASDDGTWRLWHAADGELILSGEGHTDWVGGVAFHPCGHFLASASGDATVKVWDLAKPARGCVATLAEHTAAVWSAAWHDGGEVVASAGLDHTVRVWDAARGTCKLVRCCCCCCASAGPRVELCLICAACVVSVKHDDSVFVGGAGLRWAALQPCKPLQ